MVGSLAQDVYLSWHWEVLYNANPKKFSRVNTIGDYVKTF